jgi:hypothetical protein
MLRPKIKIKRGTATLEEMQKRIADTEKLFRNMPLITVGLPRNSTPYPDGTSVIMVGFWNEFGTMDGRIPARPWLRTGAVENRDAWIAMARRIVKRCIDQGKDPLNHFALLGLQMERDIKGSIVMGAWEPNRGAYKEWKEARGKTKPLIVTGHMRASVRYVITPGGQQNDTQQSDSTP